MTDLRKAAEMALEALDYEAEEEPDSIWRAERDALRQALAQPEQEPVVKWDASAPLILDCPRCGHCCQQRQWVGLTDKEKNELVDAFYGTDIQLLEVVEAKLKEKNT